MLLTSLVWEVIESIYAFMGAKRLIKKKSIEETLLITTFYTINLGLFANIKKLFWRLNFRNSLQGPGNQRQKNY